MQKTGRTGKPVIQVIIFFVIISMSAFAVAASQSLQPPSTHPEPVSQPSSSHLVPAGADIIAVDLRIAPEWMKPGDTVYFVAEYMIKGCVKKPVFGKITLDGNTLIEQEMQNSCNNCKSPMCDGVVRVPWKVTPGTHTVVFTADSKNDIAEGPVKEQNNTKTLTFKVPLPGIPEMK